METLLRGGKTCSREAQPMRTMGMSSVESCSFATLRAAIWTWQNRFEVYLLQGGGREVEEDKWWTWQERHAKCLTKARMILLSLHKEASGSTLPEDTCTTLIDDKRFQSISHWMAFLWSVPSYIAHRTKLVKSSLKATNIIPFQKSMKKWIQCNSDGSWFVCWVLV